VAAAAGVNVETIRYYQRRKILDEPAKPLGGYRRYPVEMVQRIRFIKRAQALGFTLEDVAGLMRLDDPTACATTRELAARKLALIKRKLSELASMRDALARLVRQCDKSLKGGTCPIIQIIQSDAEKA
jgi:MerR family transcriptional regulator, mercuric resistance operon regulatory protein